MAAARRRACARPRENEQRHARAQSLHARAQARERRMRVHGINRNLPGAIQIPADERHLPQLLLRQDPKLKGKRGKNDRRIHVRGVIRRVHGHRIFAQIFRAAHRDARPRDPDAHARPESRDAVLHAPAFFKQRNQQRKRTAEPP